uniref:Uncharacterized protein n=1 Tax=Rhizophora mucronata TaxID=61149 RepID=A0A2P2NZJ6_RHIMU
MSSISTLSCICCWITDIFRPHN